MTWIYATNMPRLGLERTEHNRRLQSFRSWLSDRKKHGKSPACWGLYCWLSGLAKIESARRVQSMQKPRDRPDGSSSAEWQGWKASLRGGSTLSFAEYVVRRRSRTIVGQGVRTDLGFAHVANHPKRIRKRRREAEEVEDVEPVHAAPVEAPKPAPVYWPRHANGKRMEQPAVTGDDGLKMEPKSVVAKIERLLAAQGIRATRPA